MINEANPSVYSGSTTAKVQWFPVDPLEGAGSCGHPEDAFTSQCLWSFFFFRCIVDVQQLCEDKSRDQQNVDYWSGFFMAEGLSSPGPSCMGSA